MYLIIETLTTANSKVLNIPIQELKINPKLIQIVWLLYDSNKALIDEKNYTIRHNDFTLPFEFSKIYNITTELANAIGNDLSVVLRELSIVIDKSEYIITHNLDVEKILCAEFTKMNIVHNFSSKQRINTVDATINLCDISIDYKGELPELAILYKTLFKEEIENKHNIYIDSKAIAKCFFELVNRNIVNISNNYNFSNKVKIRKSDLVKLNLKGKIKSFSVISYKSIKVDDEILPGKKCSYPENHSCVFFNINGYKTEELKYGIDDSLEMKEIYQYDESDNLIQSVVNDYEDDLVYKKIYKYDKKRLLIEISYQYSDGAIDCSKYINDNNGNCVEQLDYDFNGVLTNMIKFKYDNNGNCIEQIEDDCILKRNFDVNDNLTRLISHRKGEKNDAENYYTYYPNGDVKTEKKYWEMENKKRALELTIDNYYVYQYDTNNNWIYKTIFSKNTPNYIIVRKIEYYET